MRCDFPLQIALEMCVMCSKTIEWFSGPVSQIGAGGLPTRPPPSPNARVPSDPGNVAPVDSIKPSYFFGLFQAISHQETHSIQQLVNSAHASICMELGCLEHVNLPQMSTYKKLVMFHGGISSVKNSDQSKLAFSGWQPTSSRLGSNLAPTRIADGVKASKTPIRVVSASLVLNFLDPELCPNILWQQKQGWLKNTCKPATIDLRFPISYAVQRSFRSLGTTCQTLSGPVYLEPVPKVKADINELHHHWLPITWVRPTASYIPKAAAFLLRNISCHEASESVRFF